MIFNRNVGFILALEVLWAFGVAFITLDIISALIYSLGGSALLVAAVSTATAAFLYAPQALVPWFQQRIRHSIGGSALGQVINVMGYSLIGVALAFAKSPSLILAAVVVGISLAAFGAAFNAPFYQNLRMRLYPSKTRSKSYSTVLFFTQIAGTLGALLAVPLLKAHGGPMRENYLWCFAVAAAFTAVSTLSYAFMRDPNPPPPSNSPTRSLAHFFRECREIWRSDRNLRVFVGSEWLNWTCSMGGTFIAFYAVTEFGQGIAPECSFVRVLAAILTVPLAHYVVSRVGSRAAIIAFYLCAIGMYASLVFPPMRGLIYIAMVFSGGTMIFRVNYLFHFVAALSPEVDKARYYALCSAMVTPMILIGPFLGGWIVRATGSYRLVFGLCIGFCLIALWIVSRALKDPVEPEAELGAVPRASLKRMTS